VLTSFRSRMNDLRERELEQAMRRLASLSPEQRDVVEQLSRSLMNKFLHEPTVRLRAATANGRGLGIVDAVRYLFALGDASMPDESETPHEARTVKKGE
jgi:glutamyl-tRNA reductase